MNDRADLTHGLVDGGEGRIDERLEGSRVRLARSDLLLGRVQGHAGREELLDGEVVQVAPDAVTLIEQRCHVLRVASGGKLEGERRLGSERLREGELRGVELGGADLAQKDENAGGDPARAQRGVERGTKGCQLRHSHRLRARHGVDDHAGAFVQHAHRTAFGWECEAQQAGGVFAVDDFGGPRVADGL